MQHHATQAHFGSRRRALRSLAAISLVGALPMGARGQAKAVNVGVILPLSGANAQFGINSRQGLELVADEINAGGGLKNLGGAKINLVGLAQAHVEYVRENVDTSKKQTLVGETASNTGYASAASNTGDASAASNTGDASAASNTGYRSAAKVSGKESVAIVTGKDSKAAGSRGCWIVLTERDAGWRIVEVRAVKVDGKTVKADVFYELVGGALREAADQTMVVR